MVAKHTDNIKHLTLSVTVGYVKSEIIDAFLNSANTFTFLFSLRWTLLKSNAIQFKGTLINPHGAVTLRRARK